MNITLVTGNWAKVAQAKELLEPVGIKINNVKIAVIINKMTASSGEFTALAIKSSSRVKFFGENSAGYTSVNQSFPLYSGTTINLTVGGVKDITNKEYFNTPITPDVRTNEPYKLASQWISLQNE